MTLRVGKPRQVCGSSWKEISKDACSSFVTSTRTHFLLCEWAALTALAAQKINFSRKTVTSSSQSAWQYH